MSYPVIISVIFSLLVCATSPAHAVVAFVEAYVDGAGGVNGLAMAQDVAVSPDGKHVYAVSEGDNAIIRFTRDAVTGKLSFGGALTNGVGGVNGIAKATALAVSPDGAHVYVASGANDGAVAVFGRNTTSGEVSFIEARVNGQGTVSGLAVAKDVVVSPDGKHVYALGSEPGAVVSFVRNATTGSLTFLEKDEEGVNGLDGVAGATELVISPDGKHVYVAAASDDAVTVFARNTTTGRLSFVESERDGVAGVDGIDGASAIAISDDGLHVYAGGANDDGLAVFSRNATNGRLTFVQAYHEGVDGVDGINSPADIAVTPDGTHVMVAASAESEVGVLARDPSTGGLTFVEAIGAAGVLGTVNSVRFAPGGKHLYTTARSSDAVAVFAVTTNPTTTTTSTSTTTTTVVGGTTLPSTTSTTSASTTSTTGATSSSTSRSTSTTSGPTTTSQAGPTTTTSSKTPTTSVPASTSTTAPEGSSTTTSVAATTSSTTLPDEPCAAIPGQSPFQRIECRLEALEHTTGTIAGLGTLQPKLGRGIGKALDRVTGAHGSCSFAKTKAARQRLKRAIMHLARYGARLRSRGARETISANLRETLAAEVNQILSAVRVLRGTLGCPGDA